MLLTRTMPLLAAAVFASGCSSGRFIHRDRDPFADLQPGWNQVAAGPGTACSDGSPYSFFVRPGDPRRLAFILQGGGACWSAATCDLAGKPMFDPTVGDSDHPGKKRGLLDFDEPRNPIREYTVITVPYCTGDLHLGTRAVRYEARDSTSAGAGDLVVHHVGAGNVEAALGWAFGRFRSVGSVLVLGSSAGAIPSPFYASLVAEQYPKAFVVQLGDGAGGYRADLLPRLLAHWGAVVRLRREREFRSLDSTAITLQTLYTVSARKSPLVVFSQVNCAADSEQIFFLGALGVRGVSLAPLLRENLAEIRRSDPDFRSYTAPGSTHTILMRPEFYSLSVDGVAIRDWVAELLAERRVHDVGDSLLAPAGH